MVKIEKYGSFLATGKNKTKKQIILFHTGREVQEYLTSLQFRYNGSYDKIPNYLIDRKGNVHQLLTDIQFSNLFSETNINKNSVTICLENLGWLEKKPFSNAYINWKGSIYNEEVYEKKWRDFFFWQPYTANQIKTTAEVCLQLMESLNIKRRCIGHNTKIEGAENFEGIISRSNFDIRYTDLNPSFDFNTFIKLIENEQFA